MRIEELRASRPARIFVWLWFVFFFHAMASGCWTPALTNILRAEGLPEWVAAAFMVPPLCALFSPLIGGALADQRVAANRLFSYSAFIGAVFLGGAFLALDLGWNPWWFIGLLGCYSLSSGPMWGYLATISLTHLPHGERTFPLVRLGATVGWACGGLVTGYVLGADAAPLAGYAGTVARVLAGIGALFLPFTPPLGRAGSWKSLLGFDAFGLLKQRDHCVFFVVTALFSIPLSAFYMYAPEQLRTMGDAHPTSTMAVAQLTEVAALLVVGSVMVRFRLKVVLLWALGLSALRFGLSAHAGASGEMMWHVMGIALHGVCYTFYFITSQVFLDRRVEPGMRGQAQGLLALVSSGIGPFIGARICGWLRDACVNEKGEGWDAFWGALALMIAACFVVFAIMYRGLRAGRDGGVTTNTARI